MSKRRLVNAAAESEEEEETGKETPEQRRARRERERRAKKKRGPTEQSGFFAGRPRWIKGAAVLGGVVAVGAAIALIALSLPHACLTISPPPATSGVPSESSWSWCVNSTDAIVEQMNAQLTITVLGSNIVIPGGIGQVAAGKWTSGGTPSQSCNMPIYTVNETQGSGDSGGFIEVQSPWDFSYTLADFFSVWHDSFSTVTVGGTSEPVSYTGTQLFSDSSNSTDIVQLWVNGQRYPASQGPELVLNNYEDSQFAAEEQPKCYGADNGGTNNALLLTYGPIGSGEVVSGPALFQTPGATFAPIPPLSGSPVLSPLVLASSSEHPATVAAPAWALPRITALGPLGPGGPGGPFR